MRDDVTVRASCLMPERLMERALSQGARFATVRHIDAHTLVVCCDAASAEILMRLCSRFSIPASVLSRSGVSALAHFVKRRMTLFAGLMVCFILCWLFLGRVWIVDMAFTGESAAAANMAQLRDAVEDAELYPGMLRSLDTDAISKDLQAVAGDFSFIVARLQGVRLLIEAVPELPAPSLYDVEAARDLVSDRNGIVVSATARSGELCVKPGDVVRRGQLLIRGEELAGKDVTRSIAALGEVIVRTWYDGEATLPLKRVDTRFTGKSSVSVRLRLFGWEWPIHEEEGFETQREDVEYLAVGGLFLPLTIERRTYRELRSQAVNTDEGQLRAAIAPLAFADAAMDVADGQVEGSEILRTWIDFETDGIHMRGHAVYEIAADAAVARTSLSK